LRAINAGFDQRVIKQTAGGADERFAGQIFFVAGLFADEDNLGAPRAFAEDGLGAAFPKVAAFTISRGIAKRFQTFAFGEKICGRKFRLVLAHEI